MPVMTVKKGKRKIGYRWGKTGKLYTLAKHGEKARELARQQGVAIILEQKRRGKR